MSRINILDASWLAVDSIDTLMICRESANFFLPHDAPETYLRDGLMNERKLWLSLEFKTENPVTLNPEPHWKKDERLIGLPCVTRQRS